MSPAHPTVFLFGDVTDSWHDGMDHVADVAASNPSIQSFLDGLFAAFRSEIKNMPRFLQDCFGNTSNFHELAQKYRRTEDDVGMVHGMLLHALRAALLLETVLREPLLLNPGEGRPESHLIGISGGLWNAVAMPIASDFVTLYESCIEIGRIYARLWNITLTRSRAMEDQSGVWGWAIVGITPAKLEKILEDFQHSMGVPSSKRVKIAITGDRWSTIVGVPSVLELITSQCSELKDVAKNELTGIRAMQHVLDPPSEADVDFVVGTSNLLKTQLQPGYKMWAMAGNDANATYLDWGHLLRVAVLQTLSQRVDMVQTVNKLSAHLGNKKYIDLQMMGPSGHAAYVVNTLKSGLGSFTRHVSVEDKLAAAAASSSSSIREGAIAVVGMSGKGPKSDNVDELWNVIETGRDCHEEIHPDRFDLSEYYCAEHGKNGPCTMACKHGCFMTKPGHFDSKFFHISPREALLMDPNHRQFLMSAYEALETAGYSAGQTKTTDPNKMAVFFAQSAEDWHKVCHNALGCDAYTMQSIQRAFGPGRLAFSMKWEGPTYALDSACAGATSSIHLACKSLLGRDIDMAVAGAANVLSDPHSFIILSKAGVLSNTSNCKTYRDDADGYCRADFSGAVVLKRLEDAVAHNDNILAVIASSARNHSGNASSITTSDANAQQRLFNKVLRTARVKPNDVSYVEMHGTGTQVGDKAEIEAVSKIFSPRPPKQPLPVGAIKANIGHSESAAGMSSVLKSIMMLQKGVIPPQAGLPHGMNPNVLKYVEDGKNVIIPTEITKFKNVGDKPKRILVNNFDAAGGNSCVLLEEYKPLNPRQKALDPRSTHVITSSARTQASQVANMKRLVEWLKANPESRLQDVAYTTTARRVQHPIRFALTATSQKEAITKLEAEIQKASAAKATPSDVVFAFTGQGSHYPGMGAELYSTNSVFRKTVDLCVTLCEANEFPAFLDVITNANVDISSKSPAQIQLAVVTLEIGLTAFWKSVGIMPAMVMGHSLGEYAALHAAGVLSLSDTLYLVGRRAGLLLERCEPDSCAMLSVTASVETVRERLIKLGETSLGVACINGPNATVISGTTDDLAKIEKDLTTHDSKIRTKLLPMPFAFHSFQMDAILADYKALASGVTFLKPKIPVASTLLAQLVDGPGVFGEDYLVQQTREAVDFCGGLNVVKSKLKDPFWLEIGPGPVCTSFVRATLSPSAAKINHSIDANTSNWASISKTLVAAYNGGIDVDWLALHAPYESDLQLLTLPTYAWDTKDYWITHTNRNSAPVSSGQPQIAAAPSEPFLSSTAQYLVEKSTSPKVVVTFRAGISEHGFVGVIDGHKMQDIGLASGTVFSDAAATVAKYALEYAGKKDVTVQHLTYHHPELLLPLTRDLVGLDGQMHTTATLENASSNDILVSFKAVSRDGKSHELGSMKLKYRDPAPAQADSDRVSFFIKSKMDERIRLSKEGKGHRIQPNVFFALFANAVEFSPDFRGVEEAYVSEDFHEAAATINLKPDPVGTRFTFSPYWGEALLHLAGFMVNGNPAKGPETTFAVMGYDSVEQLGPIEPNKQYLTYTRISRWADDSAYCAGYVFDPETSKVVLQAVDLRYQKFKTATWKHILNAGPSSHGHHGGAAAKPGKPAAKEIKNHAEPSSAPAPAPAEKKAEKEESADDSVFKIIVESLANATGSDPSEFTDETMMGDIGVDSIMAIEITGAVKKMGVELPAGFVFEYPTIGALREVYGGGAGGDDDDAAGSGISDDENDGIPTPSEETEPESADSSASSVIMVDTTPGTPEAEESDNEEEEAEDNDPSPQPSVRITLLQGRPNKSKTPLYLVADGTGSVSSFIHMRPFKSKKVVYGIDSPYYRCPSRMTSKVGIKGVAKLIVEELMKVQPEGAFQIGGYSAGCLVSYEVSRQLAAAGRKVEGLLLIDMCCPRSRRADQATLLAEDEFSYDVFQAAVAKDGLWASLGSSRDHFRAFFVAMNEYTPTPMAADERPAKTTIIWAERGLVNRVSDDAALMKRLEGQGVPTKPYPGFMEDPKLGTFACLVPDKGDNLGTNGWDKFTGGEVMALSVAGDHFELPSPSHVTLLQAQMEKAFLYFSSN